ncbi:MAG: amidohydrolase family protein [Planctomycetota bacterium]
MTQSISRLALLCALGAPAAALPQDLLPKAAPQAQPVLLQGATVHVGDGSAPRTADVYFAEGRISFVGEGASPAADVQVVDAAGKHVYPGLVLATSTLGLVEVEAYDMTRDQREAGDMNPEVYASVAVNPDSWWLPVARRNGVLVAGVFPQGGTVPGRASSIQLDGWTTEDMTLDADSGLVVRWPLDRPSRFGGGGGRSAEERVEEIDALFQAAKAYHAARKADPDGTPSDLRFESMGSVLRAETPVFLELSSREQAEQAIRWALENELVPRVIGGRNVLQFTDVLKRHGVMVSIPGTHRLPGRRDRSYRSTYELPAALEERGVDWCMTMPIGASANARNLAYEAAAAIAHGLAEEAALRSITQSAARFLGVEDRVGTVEPGKQATLFLSDGSPFDLTTKIERAWIGGREIVLEDKQTALYEKYRKKYGR